MLSGTSMLSMAVSPLGTLREGAIVCLCEDTNIGALPPGIVGRFGIGIGLELFSSIVLAVGLASTLNLLFLFLRL